MTHYSLAAHLRCCSTEDGVVILNLKSGRYQGLGGMHGHYLSSLAQAFISGSSCSDIDDSRQSDSTLADDLVKANILVKTDEIGPLNWMPDIQSADIAAFNVATKTRPNVKAGHVITFLLSCATAAIKIKFMSLQGIVKSIKKHRQQIPPQSADEHEPAIRQFANLFHYLRPLVYSSRDECLFDSLVLVEFLRYHKLYPTWIFGVTTQPFAAHCWVQHGRILLNDDPEHTRRFSPIMAV